MTGGACQPVLDVFRVFMAVRMAVAVRIVVVWMRMVMVMRVFMFMKMLLFQFVHAYRHLSFFVFYKISRRPASLSKDDFFPVAEKTRLPAVFMRKNTAYCAVFGANAREILAL